MLSDGWSTNGVGPKPPAAPHPHLCSTISVHAGVGVALFFFFACGVFLGVIRWEDPACHAPWLTPSYLYYRVARVLLERNKISREDGNFYTSEAVLSAVPNREGLRAGGHPLTLLIRARRRYALRSLLVRVRRPSRRLGLSL